MTKTKYEHIKSFGDFREEKMRLYYEIRLSEKKMEIKKMELQEYLNPIRFASAIFSELAKPLFGYFKSWVEDFIQQKRANKDARKTQNKEQKKSSESSCEMSED